MSDAERRVGYTTEDVAAMFGVSAEVIKRLATMRKIPFMFVGRYRRFSDEHIREITHILTVGPRPEPELLDRLPPRRRGRLDREVRVKPKWQRLPKD